MADGGDRFLINMAGRPLAMTVGPDGALYIVTSHQIGPDVSDFSGRIYRVIYTNNLPLTGTGIVIGKSEAGESREPDRPAQRDLHRDVEDPDRKVRRCNINGISIMLVTSR